MFRDVWPRPKISGKIEVPYASPFVIGASVSVCCAVFWEMKVWVANPASLRLVVGGCLMVGGSILGRQWAIRSLGPFHSIHIKIRDPHLSNISEAIGSSLLAGSRMVLAISLCVYRPLLVHRMIRAETALSRKLGDSFARYTHEVWMIIPTRLPATESSAPIATFTERPAEQTSKP